MEWYKSFDCKKECDDQTKPSNGLLRTNQIGEGRNLSFENVLQTLAPLLPTGNIVDNTFGEDVSSHGEGATGFVRSFTAKPE